MKSIHFAAISPLLYLGVQADASAAASLFGDMPQCATTCVASHLSDTSCKLTDIACICGDAGFTFPLAGCLLTGCSLNDMMDTAKSAFKICSKSGVEISLPSLPGIIIGGDGSDEDRSSSSGSAAISGPLATDPYPTSDASLPIQTSINGYPESSGVWYTGHTLATSAVASVPGYGSSPSSKSVVTLQSTATLAPAATTQPGAYYTPMSTMTVHPTITVPSNATSSASERRIGGALGLSAFVGILLAVFI